MAKGSKTVKAPSSGSSLMDKLRKLGRRVRQQNPARKVGKNLGEKLTSGAYLKKNKKKGK